MTKSIIVDYSLEIVIVIIKNDNFLTDLCHCLERFKIYLKYFYLKYI